MGQRGANKQITKPPKAKGAPEGPPADHAPGEDEISDNPSQDVGPTDVLADLTELKNKPDPPLVQPTLRETGWDTNLGEAERAICAGMLFTQHLIRKQWPLVQEMLAEPSKLDELKKAWGEFVDGIDDDAPIVEPDPLSYQEMECENQPSLSSWIYVPIYFPECENLEAVSFEIRQVETSQSQGKQFEGCYDLAPLSYLAGYKHIESLHVHKLFQISNVELGRP